METIEETQQSLYESPIADPIASEKLTNKLLQLTSKCKKLN